MVLTTLAALGATLGRLRARGPTPMAYATQLALGIAVADARSSGQKSVTLTHVAVGLLADPAVGRELEDRGVSLAALYEELAKLLPPKNDAALSTLPSFDADVQALLRDLHNSRERPTPTHLLDALLATGPEPIRAAFRRHDLTPESRRRPPARANAARDAIRSAPRSGPYRGLPKTDDVCVVLWNDDRTTMEFVVELLRGPFAIVPPRAVWLMLQVHREGSAVIGRFDRRSAEQLVAVASGLARDKRFPLRMTIEDGTPKPSLLARWFGGVQ